MKTKPDQSNLAAIGQMLRNALTWKAEQEAQAAQPQANVEETACPGCGEYFLALHHRRAICGCKNCKRLFRWPSLELISVLPADKESVLA